MKGLVEFHPSAITNDATIAAWFCIRFAKDNKRLQFLDLHGAFDKYQETTNRKFSYLEPSGKMTFTVKWSMT